jgi:hypothetical protein
VDLVHDDRPAQRSAELMPRVPALALSGVLGYLRELVEASHPLVAEELVSLTAEAVGAALGNHVDHAAGAPAVLRWRLAREHFEFLNR